MSEQNLELINSFSLFLKNGEISSEVRLSDPEDGDSYLTFLLRHIDNSVAGSTNFEVIDIKHAKFLIDVRPHSITRPSTPILIGTYGKDNRPMYLNFVIQPQIANTGEHEVTVSLYLSKKE